MRKIAFFVCLLAITRAAAHSGGDTISVQRLNHQEINFLENLYYGSCNPVQLSFNRVHTLTAATVETHLERGDFHGVDQGSKHNDVQVSIGGMKRFGKLSLSGDFAYLNAKDYDHKWNNTLMLSPLNPFVLADSVDSNVTLEQFSMQAAAAYRFSDRFAGALRLHYVTGSNSDQEDPRPKVNAMRFRAVPGLLFKLSQQHSLGISGEVEFFSSDLSHTLVDNYTPQTYFLMKGMGDNVYFTSNEVASYPREYDGTAFGASVQWVSAFGPVGNLLEIGCRSNSEEATDGGSYYTYKGGDYSETSLSLYDRVSFAGGSALQHDITLRAGMQQAKGDWHDQKRTLDAAHNYRVVYTVLNTSKVHETNRLSANLSYQLHHLQQGITDWSARVSVGVENVQQKHFEAAVFQQKYTTAKVSASATKYWNISDCRLNTTVGAFFRTGLGDATYASVRDKLAAQYVNPAFEYATAACYGTHVRLALDVPVQLYQAPVWMTVFAKGQFAAYGGDNKYARLYDGESRTVMDFGISLTL